MRLPSIATRNGDFALIDFAHAAQLAEWVGSDLSVPATHDTFAKLHRVLLDHLAPHASGVVLETEWGLPEWSAVHAAQSEPINTGLLLEIAQTGTVPGQAPVLLNNWGIEAVKNNYGLVLLRFPYHPREEAALIKKQFLAEIADYCIYQQVDLVLKLELGLPNFAATTDDLILALQELQRHASLLILDAPADALTAATVTVELDRPWVLHLTQASYDSQKEALRAALEAGARGYFTSQLWQDITQFRDPTQGFSLEKLQQYAQTTLRDRILELNRITAEAH